MQTSLGIFIISPGLNLSTQAPGELTFAFSGKKLMIFRDCKGALLI